MRVRGGHSAPRGLAARLVMWRAGDEIARAPWREGGSLPARLSSVLMLAFMLPAFSLGWLFGVSIECSAQGSASPRPGGGFASTPRWPWDGGTHTWAARTAAQRC